MDGPLVSRYLTLLPLLKPLLDFKLLSSLVDEFLEALPLIRFCNVNVPLRIGCDIVGTIELTGPVSATSEFANHSQ